MKYSLDILIKEFNSKNKIKFIYFWGHTPSKDGKITKTCFSQWWNSNFEVDNINYNCMEQYMMAEKARLFKDDDVLEKILNVKNPSKIKALGRKVKNFSDSIWEEKRYEIVLKGNIEKFSQNSDLKEFLLGTNGRVLVEASPYDKIWGIGISKDNEKIENPLYWNGLNLLGFALMEVRDILETVKK